MSLDMQWFNDMEARIPKGKVRTRFAPSPTGYMHVGNLRTALYTWLIARKAGGTFILRIEDTDQTRLVEGAVDLIYSTMKKCGLDHDEGPDVGGPVGPYVQTERRSLYGRYADLLIEKGGAYRCFCKKDDEAKDEDSFAKHSCPCSLLSKADSDARAAAGEPFVVRQRIPEGETSFDDAIYGTITVPNDSLDEGVLIKSDGLPTYNFANVIDDHLMGITHVVRGAEYLSSAPKYNILYKAFGWEIPTYVHCPAVMRDAHNKMSKRHGDPSFEDLLERGYLTEAVINYVALLGWSAGGEEEIFSLKELSQIFEISGVSKSPAIFDTEKLNHFNSVYIMAMEPDAFAELARPYIIAGAGEGVDPDLIAPLLQKRLTVLTEIPGKVSFFAALPEYGIDLYTNKKSKTNPEISLQMLSICRDMLAALPSWDYDSIHDGLMGLATEQGVKNATLLWPLRIAVSGTAVTPGGAVEICHILGRDECLRRVDIGIEMLKAQA